jgi:hypothetical protein
MEILDIKKKKLVAPKYTGNIHRKHLTKTQRKQQKPHSQIRQAH